MLVLLSGSVSAASGSREKLGWRSNDTLKEVIRKMVACGIHMCDTLTPLSFHKFIK